MANWWREVINHPWHKQDRERVTIDPQHIYIVRVCGFAFHFETLADLQRCLDYYRIKIHPSTRLPHDVLGIFGGDFSECQRWFERLPQYLREESKRIRVIRALEGALAEFLTLEQKDFPATTAPVPGPSPVLEMVPEERVTEMLFWRERLESDDKSAMRYYVQVKAFTFTFQSIKEIERFSAYWDHRLWGGYHKQPELSRETQVRFDQLFDTVPDTFKHKFNRDRISRGFTYAAFELHHVESGLIHLAHAFTRL
jgi:hypothetical protein